MLIVFLAPPCVAIVLAIIFFVAIWPAHEQADPRSTGTVGVRKGGRLGTPYANSGEQQPFPGKPAERFEYR